MADKDTTACASCGAGIQPESRFCGRCGALVDGEDLPTLTPAPSPRPASSKRSGPTGQTDSGGARFVPGTVLAGRYRIVALLGRGGMGEVYRADDLTLGQPVALKFLPGSAATDETLARFRNEVRIARRVSHRNVCRVYDIGETEGLHFLSMEYVDGEDLASLLKRIGRLPPDKALDVARRVCAGLAAAHEKGVLHRDLKPANVMLDRQGEIVITDFGLAAFADQVPHHDVRSGTPSYMAPEQRSGAEVTPKSDLYSLGLVLYETFTGRRAFDAKELARAAGGAAKPNSPSSVVRDLDPAVERAILWCLETDPARRPRSALAVAAALPGGDPLAAALEAGETPSPEVVAEAGQTSGLRARTALVAFAAAVLGLVASFVLSVRTSGFDRVAPEAPQVLERKAREILGRLGYGGAPFDSAWGYGAEGDLLRYLEGREGPGADWGRLLSGRPPAVFFWYRTSPRHLFTTEVRSETLTPGVVWIWDPPATLSGMMNVGLDARGRLNFLQVIPPEKDAASFGAGGAPDWDALFAAAELDRSRFRVAEPQWTSLAASDARAAWVGTWPDRDLELRVEAAAFRGRPVFFSLVGPWTHPYRMQPTPQTPGQKAAEVVSVVLVVLAIAAAALLARRNHTSHRADLRGALRLAIAVFVLHLVIWICRSHHVAGIAELGLLVFAVGNSLLMATVIWLLYLALEPAVRKRWPETIIAWSRVLAGRLRDPLVGRDLLYGVLLGLLWALAFEVSILLVQSRGAFPQLGDADYALGLHRIAGAVATELAGSIRGTLFFFFVAFLLRALLRRTWLAGLAFVALFASQVILASRHVAVEAPTQIVVYTIAFVAVARFGLVTLAAGILTVNLLMDVPVSASLASWHAGGSVLVYAFVLALAGWGLYTSLAGQRLWRADLFD
jgi:serine/threonine-protein kinase